MLVAIGRFADLVRGRFKYSNLRLSAPQSGQSKQIQQTSIRVPSLSSFLIVVAAMHHKDHIRRQTLLFIVRRQPFHPKNRSSPIVVSNHRLSTSSFRRLFFCVANILHCQPKRSTCAITREKRRYCPFICFGASKNHNRTTELWRFSRDYATRHSFFISIISYQG